MMKFMRKYGNSWFIKIMLGMIIVTFVGFFGWSAVQSPFQRDVVATVDGEPISLREYQDVYRRNYETLRRTYGNALDEKMLQNLQLGRRSLEGLILLKIQLRQAALAGLEVSDDELVRHIQGQRAFQRNGRFDHGLYTSILRRNRIAMPTYEVQQRHTLLLRKLEAVIRDSVKVTRPELEEAFRWSREGVKVRYFVLPNTQLKDQVEVKDEGLRALFDKEKEQFRIPDKKKAEYFYAGFQAIESSIDVKDEEIAKEYESRKSEFRQPERRKARHILFKLDADAGSERVERAKGKAEEVMKRLHRGEDFSELAKEFSEDPNAEEGGTLGSIGRGELDPSFEKVVFEMKAEELRGPVRTGFGFHIIRLDEIEPASFRPLTEVQATIADGLRAERAALKARENIEKVWDEISQGRSLESFPEMAGVQRGVSDFFSADGKGLAFPDSEKVATAAFRLSNGETSNPIEGDGGWYVVKISDEQPSRLPKMEEVLEAVQTAYIQQESARLAEERAKGLVKRLEAGESLEDVAKAEGLNVLDLPFFTRSQPTRSLNVGREFYIKAFGLEAGKAAQSGAEDGRVIFRVVERKPADLQELEGDGGKFREEILKRKEAVVINTWLNQSRQSVAVDIRPGLQL
jgi:peptidyl-prolyl cis-trans isomerase D